MKYNFLNCMVLVFGLTLGLYSQENGGPEGGHPKPPKEAFDACSGKSAGAACEFTGRNQMKITGTCFQPNTSLPLGCRPNNMPAKNGGDKKEGNRY